MIKTTIQLLFLAMVISFSGLAHANQFDNFSDTEIQLSSDQKINQSLKRIHTLLDSREKSVTKLITIANEIMALRELFEKMILNGERPTEQEYEVLYEVVDLLNNSIDQLANSK